MDIERVVQAMETDAGLALLVSKLA